MSSVQTITALPPVPTDCGGTQNRRRDWYVTDRLSTLQRINELGQQRNRLALRLMHRSSVDDGLSIALATEHYHQVRDQCAAALIVELDDLFFRQHGDGHFDHSDRAFN